MRFCTTQRSPKIKDRPNTIRPKSNAVFNNTTYRLLEHLGLLIRYIFSHSRSHAKQKDHLLHIIPQHRVHDNLVFPSAPGGR